MSLASERAVTRVAMLTPEFVTESHGGGGVGNYVSKMATALRACGVEVEIFVPSRDPGLIEYRGFQVHRVPNEPSLGTRVAVRALRPIVGPRSSLLAHLSAARSLARALERRHAEKPFDVVQSSNHQLTGFFVRPMAKRTHVVRISTARRLYDEAYGRGRQGPFSRLTEWLDVRTVRRADLTYAPSRYLASYFNRTYATNVHVLRPPVESSEPRLEEAPLGLPERYLVHFGSLGARKGTDAVAEALALAWQEDPTVRMVWAGRLDEEARAAYRRAWGSHQDDVTILGALDKAQLYAVVSGAIASVLPSTVDNLPNTVIESLTLGVPVIGSDGASIDELVEHERSGLLVPIKDVEALAHAMVVAWRADAPWLGAGFTPPAVLHTMQPDEAVRRFVDLVSRSRSIESGGPRRHLAEEHA